MATFGDMVDEISDDIGDDVDATAGDYTLPIKRAIVASIRDFRDKRFWFNEGIYTGQSTAAAIETVTKPERVASIDQLKITVTAGTPYNLIRRDWPTFSAWRVEASRSQGSPRDYAERNRIIYFNPVPDGVYALEYEGVLYASTTIEVASQAATSNWWTDRDRGYDLIMHSARYRIARNTLHDAELASAARLGVSDAKATLGRELAAQSATGRIRPRGVLNRR